MKLAVRVRGMAVTVTVLEADLVGSAVLVAVTVAVELALTAGD
jgi:hypothetical protein